MQPICPIICMVTMLLIMAISVATSKPARAAEGGVPENLYKGELISYPGAYAFELPRAGIILVRDADLDALQDPDTVVDLSTTFDKYDRSLRQICEEAQKRGCRTLIVAYDHFFEQYRPGQHAPRKYTSDSDEFITRIAKIGAFAQNYGLGLELSVISPLELGVVFAEKTGQSGKWVHYREGSRDPSTGNYNVAFWRQKEWTNNKGIIDIVPDGVRVLAFREVDKEGPQDVNPDEIIDITETCKVDESAGVTKQGAGIPVQRIIVSGTGRTDLKDYNRVMVIQRYKTPEMDYFSPEALKFMKQIIDKYAAAGVKLNALYSDEMHIQQDWSYFAHHDNGEFALRYLTDNMAARYAELYGDKYRDMEKMMVYMASGQHDMSVGTWAKDTDGHVFDKSAAGVAETALFRSRYFKLLQDQVTDIFAAAKHYAEEKMGHTLESRAHATWAESPTIDYVANKGTLYEYTDSFTWSCTVHQAAAACADYFKWGDYLTGNGNDTAECGFLDRNYWGLSLACSIGSINDVSCAYAAHWGMPGAVHQRRTMLADAVGATGHSLYGSIQDMQHRKIDVLTLYPIDLHAWDERFGSWTTQYAYTNYITQQKLLELAKWTAGTVEVRGYKYTTLCVHFEPFPTKKLLQQMSRFVDTGGKLVWSGPIPVLTSEGDSALPYWQSLFGVTVDEKTVLGDIACGRRVSFEGTLAGLPEMTILTDKVVDRIYSVAPRPGTQVVAKLMGKTIGTYKAGKNGGMAIFLGFRPRDDQAASLGYEMRVWFDVLNRINAYPSTGRYAGINDNPEYVSRNSEYFANRFPNGAVMIVPHLKDLVEDWDANFARDAKKDAEIMKGLDMPSAQMKFKDYHVDGHVINGTVSDGLCFRLGQDGQLVAISAGMINELSIDGRKWKLTEKPVEQIVFTMVSKERKLPSGAVSMLRIQAAEGATATIPASLVPEGAKLYAQGAQPGSKGGEIAYSRKGSTVIVKMDAKYSRRWLYFVK
ncbi:MAG: hypothetical protein ACYC1M_17840 [Armatimonadota bacterium]